MATVINCNPVRVIRTGKVVVTILGDDEAARSLEEGLLDAKRAKEDPASFYYQAKPADSSDPSCGE